jgi:hypothetical protein
VEWIESVLAPARPLLTVAHFERLVSGLTLCVGIESLITLQDIRRLAREEAIDICRWAAHAMFETALRERNDPVTKSRRSPQKPKKASPRAYRR